MEVTGHIIGDLKMGALQTTFSKDGYNNLYVVLTDKGIPTEVLKQIHMEIKSLFMNSLDQIGISLDPEEMVPENLVWDEKAVSSIFDPFFRLWTKKVSSYLINC